MRIDVRSGILIEGQGDELVSLAEAILLAAYGGPECVGAYLTPAGVAPVRVVRLGGRAPAPELTSPIPPWAAARPARQGDDGLGDHGRG